MLAERTGLRGRRESVAGGGRSDVCIAIASTLHWSRDSTRILSGVPDAVQTLRWICWRGTVAVAHGGLGDRRASVDVLSGVRRARSVRV